MNILENKVSCFKSLASTQVTEERTIREILKDIKEGEWIEHVDKVRGGDKGQKRHLPTFAMHGLFDSFRNKKNFIEANGIIILDIDDVEVKDIQEIKQDIFDDYEHVVAVMTSPSGNGIKVLYYVNPDMVNTNNYRQIGKQLVDDFSIYGEVDFLSITDTLLATYDDEILIRENPAPDFIYIKEIDVKESELEPLDKSKVLWEDAEDFFETVLSKEIENRVNNNFHYIQVAVLDLAKFGFKSPEHDLSFVVDYAEECFKYSTENKARLKGVIEVAASYPQQKWPYNYLKDEEDDDFYGTDGDMDYSDYIAASKPKTESEKKIVEEIKEEEGDAFVDYEGLFESVLEVVKEGDRVGKEISLKNFADIFRFRGTGILTVTGIPGHGKTEFVDQVVLDLARLHGSGTIVAGFEQSVEEHLIKLCRKLLGFNVTCKTWFGKESNIKKLREAYDYVTSNITHIDTNKTGGNINRILDACASKIAEKRSQGECIEQIVLDPFNMLSIKGKLSGFEKIDEILRKLTHFSHQMEVMVILVAHPFKMPKDEKTGEYQIPDFYSVKGSSSFFEMSYHGLTVYRSPNGVMVKVLKVKQNNLGETNAEATFDYERNSGRYIPKDEMGNIIVGGDYSDKDWLSKADLTNIKK